MAKREHKPWMYQMPDDRNRLIDEAREIIAFIYGRPIKCTLEELAKMEKPIARAARRWLKETKA